MGRQADRTIGESYSYYLLSTYYMLGTYISYLFLTATLQSHLYYSHFIDRKVQLSHLLKCTPPGNDSTGI